MLLHHCQFKHFSHERIIKKITSLLVTQLFPLSSRRFGPMDPWDPSMGPVEKTRRPNGLVPICSFDWISFCCHDSADRVMGVSRNDTHAEVMLFNMKMVNDVGKSETFET